MDFSELIVFIRVVIKELWAHKFAVLIGAAVVGFAVLLIGIKWPVSYESSTTIFADNQNILKPLLAKQAEVSKVQDQVRVVRETMLSQRMLNLVIEKAYGAERVPEPEALEKMAKEIRSNLDIASLGKSHIKITYIGNSADDTYNVINALTDLFIKDSSETKRAESREAFQFIDKQVKQYKDQLVEAEDKLKAFQSENFDGTDVDVGARIANLRDSIENQKLAQDEIKTRIRSLDEQLAEEDRFSAKKFKADVYRERLSELLSRRDSLLLTYKPSHPDVVSIGLQIEDMQTAIKDAELEPVVSSPGGVEASVNPLYQELRSKLADSKVQMYTGERRLEATQKLLNQEFERRKRIAAREAELAELTRDYTVTKKIYEDMLERKENARLSMTLNIEGQGITYKIQEPSQYPLAPKGLQFIHFVVIGLILGTLVPIGMLVLYILVDPRIRFVRKVESITPVPLLAVVPHAITPISKRIFKTDMLIMFVLASALVAAYVGVAYSHYTGII